jgi:protein subunit release factor A
MKVTDDQFRYEWFSGTGPGGQHRNKTENCCRCIHVPTGIKATASSARSRKTNMESALAVCKARVVAHFHKDKERYQAGSERIRTYHECDNRVVDHASGETDTYTNVIEKNFIDDMVTARAKATR